jgi:acetyl esterase/lipase
MNRRGLIAAAAALVTSACSPLELFNRFSPKDAGGRLAVRDVAYGADPRQRLDVYEPVRRGPGPAPVLVFFFGGGWDSGDKDLYRWVGQAFAARGFLTVLPNYRLVPQVRFPAFVEDGAAAIAKTREIAARYGGDPDRIAFAGHSAGAYIAILLALDTRYLEAAKVDPAAVRAAVGLSGPYDFLPFDVAASINAFGQAPDPVQTQPIHFARAGAPPLFLGHGTKDTVVMPRNSTALAAAERAKGGEVELKIYPGLDHPDTVLALSRPFRGKAPVLDDVVGFLQAHLGGGGVSGGG